MPTISDGGVSVPHAFANVPAFSAPSSLCFGTIHRLSSSRRPGPDGAGNVMTTDAASRAEAAIGFPSTFSVSAMKLSLFGSQIAWTEYSTSSDVNGTPSDHVTPGRRWNV